jgi:hypothetical protein
MGFGALAQPGLHKVVDKFLATVYLSTGQWTNWKLSPLPVQREPPPLHRLVDVASV